MSREEEAKQQQAEDNKRKELEKHYQAMDKLWADYYTANQQIKYHFLRDRDNKDDKEMTMEDGSVAMHTDDSMMLKTGLPDYRIYKVYVKDKNSNDVEQPFNLSYTERGVRPSEDTPRAWSAAIDFIARECLTDTMVLSITATPLKPDEAEAKLRMWIQQCTEKGLGARLNGNAQEFVNSLSKEKQDRMMAMLDKSLAVRDVERVKRAEGWTKLENKELQENEKNREVKPVTKLELNSSDPTRDKDTIYLDTSSIVKGTFDEKNKLKYEVHDKDGKLQKGSMAWDKLPKDFNKVVDDLLDKPTDTVLKEKVLKGVLEFTEKAKLTPTGDKKWDELNKSFDDVNATKEQKIEIADKMVKELATRMEKLEIVQNRLGFAQQAETEVLKDPERIVKANYGKSAFGGELKSVNQVVKMVELSNPGDGQSKKDLLVSVEKEQKYLHACKETLKTKIDALGLTPEEKKKLQSGMTQLEKGLGAKEPSGALEEKRKPLQKYNEEIPDKMKKIKSNLPAEKSLPEPQQSTKMKPSNS